jgi:hypothetical protein
MPGMLRRWLIRVPFLLTLVCVPGVWVVSYFGALAAYTDSHGDRRYVSAVQGLWDMGKLSGVAYTSRPYFGFYRGLKTKDWNLPPTTLGFYFGSPLPFYHGFEIIFPLWLPTLLLAALNRFIWRKTRHSSDSKGFPVEAASGNADEKGRNP